jgi:spectinomycin phosphotransferase
MLRDAYGLTVGKISFHLALILIRLYIVLQQAGDYFLKLRGGEFNDASVLVPKYFAELSFKQVIPSLKTEKG